MRPDAQIIQLAFTPHQSVWRGAGTFFGFGRAPVYLGWLFSPAFGGLPARFWPLAFAALTTHAGPVRSATKKIISKRIRPAVQGGPPLLDLTQPGDRHEHSANRHT